jgi:monoamine oxidase
VLHHWGTDPFARGAYTAIDDASWSLLDAFDEPVGRVAFAGEHAIGAKWHGTMEGAVRSGRRAAQRIAGLLGRTRPAGRC